MCIFTSTLPGEETAFVPEYLSFEQLDDSQLGDLLVLKYHALADAKAKLGDIPSIRDTFIGFQQHLYGQRVGSSA